MASSIILVTIFFTFFIFLLPFPSNSSKTLEEICNINSPDWNNTFCIQTLTSEHRIVSATNLVSLAIGIVESGMLNATNTSVYIKNNLQKSKVIIKPINKRVFNQCVESYEGAIDSFRSAFLEIKDGQDYETPSYDVLIAADHVKYCEETLVLHKVDAPFVSAGNKFVRYFALAADQVVTRLWVKSHPKMEN